MAPSEFQQGWDIKGHAMLSIPNTIAVYEIISAQLPIRQTICHMLLEEHTKSHIADTLGISRWALGRHIVHVLRDFREAGFSPPPVRKKKPGLVKQSTLHAGMQSAVLAGEPHKVEERKSGGGRLTHRATGSKAKHSLPHQERLASGIQIG